MTIAEDVPWGPCRIVWPSAQPMYEAARRWRDDSLLDDRSLFSGRQIDVVRASDELVQLYVNNLDMGSGTFTTKLQAQLAEAGDDAIQVAAELLYVHALIASTTAWSARKKTELVNTVIAFGSEDVSAMPADLEVALSGGAAGTGQAYLNYRWKMFAYLIEVYRTIKGLPRSDRELAVGSLEHFRTAVAAVDTQSVWTQQYALEHLLFPDVAPAILSRNDRFTITQAFPEAGSDIVQVCRALEPNVTYGNRSCVDPYLYPLRQQWNPSEAEALYAEWASKVMSVVDLDDLERDYKMDRVDRFRTVFEATAIGQPPHAPLKAALSGYNVVDFRVANTFLGWVEANPNAASAALAELQINPGPESIDRFLEQVPWEGLPGIGARLSIASTLLLGCAPERLPPWRDTAARTTQRLSGGYAAEAAATAGEIYLAFLERLDMILGALNTDPANPVLRDRLDAQGLAWTLARPKLDVPGWSAAEREAFVTWQQGRGTTPAPPAPVPESNPIPESDPEPEPEPHPEPQSFDELVARLHLDDLGAGWLEETLLLLSRKRQIILQGPPGTGKTYLAREVALFLGGAEERVTTVQFHPGTSYEDFVQGLRPDPADPGRFTVVNGPLINIAQAAAQDPTKTYVLVIDEINRGNIPAIFGELYLLLEYRDRPVTLLYGQQQVLPPNLLVIGTMNTADRSITTLDAALRRRFYIRDLRPDQPPVDGMLRRYLARQAPDLHWLADVLDAANRAIGEPDQYIGPSHFMGEVDETWARRAWTYSVMPTLRELYYSDPARANALEFDILRESVINAQSIVD